MIGVKMGDHEIGEIRRLHVHLREALGEQSVGPGIVDHGLLVEIVLPVLAETIAHPGIDEDSAVVVLDHIRIYRMGDFAVRTAGSVRKAPGAASTRCPDVR